MKVHDDIMKVAPYSPGKPIEEVERELGISGAIKLASNENPLGPSPKALKAIRRVMGKVHRYPDGGGLLLKEALAKKWGVGPSQIILGNGSDEIISLLVRTFMMPGDEAIMADLTFAIYKSAVMASHGAPVIVPLREHRHDLVGMARKVTARTRLIFIANPNNPTGTIVKKDEVTGFLADLPDTILVVCDEAYYEYVTDKDYPDSLSFLRAGKSVAALRTFSKMFGLAGLRIGYGMASAEIVSYVERVRQPFNTNTPAQEAAIAALTDDAHVAESRKVNEEGKSFLYRAFQERGIRCVPTEANFIYFDAGKDGQDVYQALLRLGVIVRHITGSWLRVTIGLPKENRAFLQALKKVFRGKRQ